jgi:hypothetical protein
VLATAAATFLILILAAVIFGDTKFFASEKNRATDKMKKDDERQHDLPAVQTRLNRAPSGAH